MAKTFCPVTRAEFVRDARPVEITINGIPMTAEVKEFSTGSLGWYLNSKASVKVGEKSVTVQIGMNLTIVGSKGLPKDESEPPASQPPKEATDEQPPGESDSAEE